MGGRRLWLLAGGAILLGALGWYGWWVLETRRQADQRLALIQEEESFSDEPSVEQAAERIRNYSNKIGAAAASMNPSERKALFATQRVFARLAPLMAGYEAAMDELNDAGGADPSSLTSLEEIARREKLARQFQDANRAVTQFYQDLEKNFRSEINREKLSDSVKTEVAAAFARGASIEANLTLREHDRLIAEAVLEVLSMLRLKWGGWSLQKDGGLTFEQDAVLGEYLAFQEKIRLHSELLGKEQAALIGRAQKGRPSR